MKEKIIGAIAVIAVFAIGLFVDVNAANAATLAPFTADFIKTCEALPLHAGDSYAVWDIQEMADRIYMVGSFDKVRCPDGSVTVRDNVAVLSKDSKHVLAEQYTFGNTKQYSSNPDSNCKIDNWNVSTKAYTCDTVYQVKPGSNNTVYFAGAFTSVNGVTRNRIAQVQYGSLTGFAPAAITGNVRALVVHGSLYAGGEFTKVGAATRTRLAAFNPTTGGLYGWNASANGRVLSMIGSPDNFKLILGGDFSKVNNTYMPRLGAVSLANGTSFVGWKFNWNNSNHETKSRITSFAIDGQYVYLGAEGDGLGFDGRKKIDSNGNTIWTDYCQGATWAVAVDGNEFASGSHAHSCGQTPGGFPNIAELDKCLPAGTCRWQRVLIQNKNSRYIYHMFPQLDGGPAGPKAHFPSRLGPRAIEFIHGPNGRYVLVGGQSYTVNGQVQMGLVAFGNSAKSFVPLKPPAPVLSRVNGRVNILVRTTEDYDDRLLTYRVYRNGSLISTGQSSSGPGLAQKYTVVDSASSGTYSITVTDSRGNTVGSDSRTI